MCVKFQFSSYNIFRDMRGTQFTLGRCAHGTPRSQKIIYRTSAIDHAETRIKFHLSSSNSFRDMRISKFTLGSTAPPPPSVKVVIPIRALDPI